MAELRPVVPVLLAICLCLSPCRAQETALFVSPSGSDAHPGTKDQPFATLARAQAAVREIKTRGGLKASVVVHVLKGTYVQEAPLVFTPADSGTAECPVTYRGVGDGAVVISGGRRLTGFKKAGKLWTVVLEDVRAGTWIFHRLYVNGRHRPRARTPNEGRYFRIYSPLPGKKDSRLGFWYAKDDLREGQVLDEAVFVVFGSWYNTIHHVDRVDAASRIVWFTNPSGRPFSWYEKNLRYYVENTPEGLDEPGEWYLNRTTGVLSYYPLPGERIEETEFVAPVVKQTLIRLQGEPGTDRCVEHIHLKGLQILHTDAHLPRDLYDARQAATVQDAGVLADGARHCVIEGCEVANMGEQGIWFRDDCHHNTVRRCHVHDLGGGGIYIGEKWRWGRDCPGWPGYGKFKDIPHFTEHNVVDNCFVHDGCQLFTGAIGIWVGQASHTTVSHNDICDVSYSGISVGWDWSGHKSTAHHNIIEHNHIHHIGHGRMNDMAGIYTLGVSPGTVLRQNVIHDVQAYQSPVAYCLGGGIYLDQSSGEITIENNICYNISNAGFFLHHGTNNRLVNNVFARIEGKGRIGWGMYLTSRRGKADKGNSAGRNIVCVPSGKAAKATQQARGKSTGGEYEFVAIDKNLYHSTPGRALVFSTAHHDEPAGLLDLAAWRKLGYDVHSIAADPLFVNAEAHDYRLRADSPARALGINSIDTSDVGLYGDKAWVSLPGQVRLREPDPESPFTPSVILALDEDYEDEPVGHVPDHAQFTDKAKGAVVEVTDAVAADGRKCLRFADAPGLKAAYHPNRVWSELHVRKGAVTLRFDCRNSREAPATFLVELRDWTEKGYKPGPSLLFQPDGQLRVGKERPLPYEPGEWYHVEISFALGEGAAKSYQLIFAPKGEAVEPLTVPLADGAFSTLTWLGFIAMDKDRRSEFCIDNLHVTME